MIASVAIYVDRSRSPKLNSAAASVRAKLDGTPYSPTCLLNLPFFLSVALLHTKNVWMSNLKMVP